MITGMVNARHEAVIKVPVGNLAGQDQEIEAILDTGFTGSLTFTWRLVKVIQGGRCVCVGSAMQSISWLTQRDFHPEFFAHDGPAPVSLYLTILFPAIVFSPTAPVHMGE